jgi:hypothetical protein
MADHMRTSMLADRLIIRGADAYDEARFAHIFNARRPDPACSSTTSPVPAAFAT